MKGCRPLSDAEVLRLRKALSTTRYAARNIALLDLGLYTGYRISELLSLRLRDVCNESGQLVSTITVDRRFMKGKHESRSMCLPDPAKESLRGWLDELYAAGCRAPLQYVFVSSRWTNRRMHPASCWLLLHNAARAAGIGGRIGTHSMRKTYSRKFLTLMLQDATHSQDPYAAQLDAWRALQQALGHKSIASTQSYVGQVDEGKIFSVVGRIRFE